MAERQTTDTREAAESKRPIRKRSTGFPVVSLAEVEQVLKEAGRYGFDHTLASFASAMGHKTTNSGAFRQRLAAFRDWGLVTGRRDTVTMTEVARVIAVSTDETERRLALQQAFWNCEIFSGLYEQVAKGEPLDHDGLGAQAVLRLGVAPGKRQTFVKSFVDSVEAAQLVAVDGHGNVVLVDPGTGDEADDEVPSDHSTLVAGEEDSRHTVTATASRREVSGVLSPTIRQSWPITNGEIILEVRSEEALPAVAFGVIGELVTRLEALAASLSQGDDSGADTDGGET